MAIMANHWIPKRRLNFKAKQIFKHDELRRRRQEQQLERRKEKREGKLAKMRGISCRGKSDIISRSRLHHKTIPKAMRIKSAKRKIRDRSLVGGEPQHIGSYTNIVNWPVFVHFLRLPAEIRLNIYEYALQCDEEVCKITETTGIPEPALLLTCKTFRREAISVFYSIHTFVLVAQSFSPSIPILVGSKAATLKEQHGCIIKNLRMNEDGPPSWHNLVRWLQTLHQGEHSCIRLGRESIDGVHWDPAYTSLFKEYTFIVGLFEMFFRMRDKPWRTVEDVLSLMRPALAQFHLDWDTDQTGDAL